MNSLKKKEYILFFAILAVFVFLRIPGLDNLYHQDEYKWPSIVLSDNGYIPHPPMGEAIYSNLGKIVGYDNFRVIPFVFSILNFFLLFYLVKIIFDSRTALWSVFLFSVSFYS
ncbi:MAG: hypothetical protein AAB861_01545, partial [Patescibacteria group bacterium]